MVCLDDTVDILTGRSRSQGGQLLAELRRIDHTNVRVAHETVLNQLWVPKLLLILRVSTVDGWEHLLVTLFVRTMSVMLLVNLSVNFRHVGGKRVAHVLQHIFR